MTKRNIDRYTFDYMNHEFENVMVKIRQRHILDCLNLMKPRHILEIGCGTESIAQFYDQYEEFTIIEPSTEFCQIVASKMTRQTDFVS